MSKCSNFLVTHFIASKVVSKVSRLAIFWLNKYLYFIIILLLFSLVHSNFWVLRLFAYFNLSPLLPRFVASLGSETAHKKHDIRSVLTLLLQDPRVHELSFPWTLLYNYYCFRENYLKPRFNDGKNLKNVNNYQMTTILNSEYYVDFPANVVIGSNPLLVSTSYITTIYYNNAN
jgi:hypothetical protein